MKLHSPVQDQAVLSNVGEIGEFRIRNSAKAFNILSSGLYANKIRAIIRELSCNAVDSHIAAGKNDTPFDIHLPNSLEPYFSIRDYGTGLNNDQVTNIYTTYFESTKTNSNDFIGALGLGSKSPFSYTNNFTVTAIKNGRKGIYTAFINEQGVPSIALMLEEDTTDPNGVEVRFAVEDRYDFEKFRSEAQHVYKYFKLRPVVSGNEHFRFVDPQYTEKDIIPGVHTTRDGRYRSVAIMGNIEYPIDVPDNSLGTLQKMLDCGLVMEFDIGELDFQASREGLSYIPETINAIKNKLEKLKDQLVVHLAKEADKISNLWERAMYLYQKHQEHLFSAAVGKYVNDTKFELYSFGSNGWGVLKTFELGIEDLIKKYNISIRSFYKGSGNRTVSQVRPSNHYVTDSSGQKVLKNVWDFRLNDNLYFVINDTNVGALERAKYHWKNTDHGHHSSTVYVLEAFDKSKPIKYNQFFKDISNPPKKQILLASSLKQKDRAKNIGKNVTILELGQKYRGREYVTVWEDAGKVDDFSDTETHYYLPLCGFKSEGVFSDVKEMNHLLKDSELFTKTIYGVRKADINFIRSQKNWINLDDHIKEKLVNMTQVDLMGAVKASTNFSILYQEKQKVTQHVNPDSPYVKLYNVFKDVSVDKTSKYQSVSKLFKRYDVKPKVNLDPNKLITKYNEEIKQIYNRYPLLNHFYGYGVNESHLAEYINLIDEKKGI